MALQVKETEKGEPKRSPELLTGRSVGKNALAAHALNGNRGKRSYLLLYGFGLKCATSYAEHLVVIHTDEKKQLWRPEDRTFSDKGKSYFFSYSGMCPGQMLGLDTMW